jgi:DNA repair exonuclease SbcCD ATPase subunit
MQIKKTLTRPKPESDRVTFEVPAITTYELWESANSALRERGRGRGKQGKKIQALFRGRMICPVCGKTMAVMRRKNGRFYYYCRSRYCKWLKDPCPYSSFVPGTWDEEIWDEICELLKNDVWIEQQLSAELDNSQEIEKLIKLQERKISNYQSKIRKVEEGFEGGLYTLEEAKHRKQKSLEAIKASHVEVDTLKKQMGNGFTPDGLEKLKLELRNLQDRNMAKVSFEERLDSVASLGIKVCPAEDLKSRRIKCGLDIRGIPNTGEQSRFAKVVYGSAYRIKGKTFEKTFKLVF